MPTRIIGIAKHLFRRPPARPRPPAVRLVVTPLERRDVPAVLEGFVFYDLNGDGVYNTGEPGVQGAEVEVNGEGYGYATVGSDGWYRTDDFGTNPAEADFFNHAGNLVPTIYIDTPNCPEVIRLDVPIAAVGVTVSKVSDAVEGGAGGLFQFTRTGDTSQELTVYYTIGTASERSATPGADYVPLTGTATFAEGSDTAYASVAPRPDNEFEDPEEVRITLVAPPSGAAYVPAGETTQVVTITDNPPQVVATVFWEQIGTEIGRVILTRSGGDFGQPLTAWFEVEGTVEDEGETLTFVLAAVSEFPAGETALNIPILVDPDTGELANAQMPGATPTTVRADTSQAI